MKLNVNGQTHQLDVEPEMPLLWALRDELDIKGPKYGCGIAQCGACTVHVNGEPMRSCSYPVSAAVGSQVLTIEGLSKDGTHPVQMAWKALDVPQCGYCQSGQIMKAAELLAKTPRPNRDQIVEHMDGNLCRCGSYPRIVRAIERAAKEG